MGILSGISSNSGSISSITDPTQIASKQNVAKINPYDTSKATGIAQQGQALAQQQQQNAQGVSQTMADADAAYGQSYGQASNAYNAAQGTTNDAYLKQVGALSQQASDQATKAGSTYTNTIAPALKGIMSTAQQNASQAMSLKDAGDPNNSVQTAVRKMYDDQAQGVKTQGMADYGTMAALGGQAASAQFGAAGGPMTSGTMGQIYGQGQQQAGNAYAAAQQRATNLQQQGIDQGFAQSDAQYQRGVGAQQTYRQSVGDVGAAQNQYLAQQQGARQEIGGYNSDQYGIKSQANADQYNQANTQAGIAQQTAYGQGNRDLASMGQSFGYQQQGVTNQLGIEAANKQAGQTAVNTEQQNAGKIASSATGAGIAASDERTKANIRGINSRDLDEFFHAVKPKAFDYKNPGSAGQTNGRKIGFMMQDVEDTKLGRQIMRPGPSGEKMYDTQGLQGIILAGLAQQSRKSA